MATYGRALQQRNGLLRRIRDGEADADQLPYWSAIISEEGGAIVGQRLALLADLAPILAASHAQIAPAEAELRLRYVTNAPADAQETPEAALRAAPQGDG